MNLPTDYAWIFLPLVAYIAARTVRRLRERASHPRVEPGGAPPELTGPTHQDIFRAARAHGGRLTVSELIMETGIASKTAEDTLRGLADGTRVRLEIDADGVEWYEFPELLPRIVKNDILRKETEDGN
ncbi:MAG TPA: hypothetical protein VMW87_14215 [Spirochaetia bacterium]|nr:hypothetical protein [Spirochaetia bacterium]